MLHKNTFFGIIAAIVYAQSALGVASMQTAFAKGIAASGSPTDFALSTHAYVMTDAIGYAAPISSLAMIKRRLQADRIPPHRGRSLGSIFADMKEGRNARRRPCQNVLRLTEEEISRFLRLSHGRKYKRNFQVFRCSYVHRRHKRMPLREAPRR